MLFETLKSMFNNKLSVFTLILFFILAPSSYCFAADDPTPRSIIVYILGTIFVVLLNIFVSLLIFGPIIWIIYAIVILPKREKQKIKDYVEKYNLRYIEKTPNLPNNIEDIDIDIDFIQFNGSRYFTDVIIFQKDNYSYVLTNLKYTFTSSKGECGTYPLPLLIIVDKNQNFPFFYLKDAHFEKILEQRCAYSGSKFNRLDMEEEYRKRLSFYRGHNIVMEEDPEFEEKYSLEVDENGVKTAKEFFDHKKRSLFNELDNKYYCYEGNGNLFVICSAVEIPYFKDRIKFMEKGLELYNKLMY